MTAFDNWYAMPVLSGRLVRLEPLAVEHADGYFAAAGTGEAAEETFRWMPAAAPVSRAEAEEQILIALGARARGERFAYAQLDPTTDEVIGTTSYYELSPPARAIAIGNTWLGSRWWRSGHNTESKLLMLTHAFDGLGAARVVWHTDINNIRSQDAIARLGATREGELRKHRIRRDGSWRTTVQYSMTDDDWPAVRARLVARLAAGS
ncbi:MAG: GCN5-like N-acetyltransferase [Pseudonocardiales bacterium]|nr:GCN5-like N-acetyltransferase [Pseudonocardiales bacterium]